MSLLSPYTMYVLKKDSLDFDWALSEIRFSSREYHTSVKRRGFGLHERTTPEMLYEFLWIKVGKNRIIMVKCGKARIRQHFQKWWIFLFHTIWNVLQSTTIGGIWKLFTLSKGAGDTNCNRCEAVLTPWAPTLWKASFFFVAMRTGTSLTASRNLNRQTGISGKYGNYTRI